MLILAKMYFLMGQKTEAAEISSRLVAKLPFCYEANRILAEVLPETSRSEDARVYQQRLLALDPYLGYISKSSPTIAQVPDQVVTVNRLEWMPSLQSDQEPAWSKSLGITIEAREEEIAEDWFTPFSAPSETSQPESTTPQLTPEEAGPVVAPATDQITPAENQTRDLGSEAEEIPDWMSSAGWGVSEHPADEPFSFDSTESQALIGEEPEPLPAEMPDWLKDIAPASETISTPAEEQAKLDWLASILPEESGPAIADQAEVVQSIPEVPTPTSAPEMISPMNEDLPDWMRSGVTAPEESSNPFEISEEPLPDWLTETSEPSAPVEPPMAVEPLLPVEPPEMPEFEPDEVQELPEALISESIADTIPVSIQPAESNPPRPDLSNVDDAMAWLESLAAKQGADEEALLTKPEDRQEQPPEWVTAAVQSAETEEIIPELASSEIEPISEAEQEISQPEVSAQIEPPSEPASMEPQENIPAPTAEIAPETEIEPVAEIPESLPLEAAAVEPEEATPADGVAQPEAVLDTQSPPEELAPSEPAEQDMDAAFAWLESLAAKQGAGDKSLLVSPEERLETPPDWVKEQTQEISEDLPLAEPVPAPETEVRIPEWMQYSGRVTVC